MITDSVNRRVIMNASGNAPTGMFRIERLDALLVDQLNVSSSRSDNRSESGNIAVNHYAGYIYELNGRVVEGLKVGRK